MAIKCNCDLYVNYICDYHVRMFEGYHNTDTAVREEKNIIEPFINREIEMSKWHSLVEDIL